MKLGDRVKIQLDSDNYPTPNKKEVTHYCIATIIGSRKTHYQTTEYLIVTDDLELFCQAYIECSSNNSTVYIGNISEYLNRKGRWACEASIVENLGQVDGCYCNKCKEFSRMALPNMGKEFRCYSCRQNPYR